MGSETTTSTNEVANSVGSTKLAILISMAMFVLVIDTAIMNVSIASISKDLNTTVSNIQAMIAIEALVSAAFILIGGKVADLIGRKRAYSLGLLGYGLGALSMILSDTLLPMLIFWAILGGLGASLLLPSVQSLIHGNFEGLALKKAYAMVGASTSIAIAIGPLLGGFLTTYLSWRVGFVLEVVIILIVVSGLKLVKDVPYTGSREIDPVGAVLSAVGMGGIVLSILVWQEGGDKVGLLMAIGVVGITGLAYWLNKRKKEGKPILLDPGLFSSKLFRTGISGQMLQQIALGGMMIAMPIFLQMVLEYNSMQAGLTMAPMSISMFLAAVLMGRAAGKFRPATIIRFGFGLLTISILAVIYLVPRVTTGLYLFIPFVICGVGLGLMVSQLNNYTLSPVEEERISEAAGVNSAAGSFGMSFGLAFAGAILLMMLSFTFTYLSNTSTVLAADQKAQVATALEHDAEVMSNTQMNEALVGQSPEVQQEITRINTIARPIALQVALLVPLLAGFIGLIIGFRMMKLPDPVASSAAEEMVLG
jgi:MFS family permease